MFCVSGERENAAFTRRRPTAVGRNVVILLWSSFFHASFMLVRTFMVLNRFQYLRNLLYVLHLDFLTFILW